MMGVPPNIFQALTLIKINYLQVENRFNLKPIGLKLTHIARNERYEKPFSCTDPKYCHDIPNCSIKFALFVWYVIYSIYTCYNINVISLNMYWAWNIHIKYWYHYRYSTWFTKTVHKTPVAQFFLPRTVAQLTCILGTFSNCSYDKVHQNKEK